MVEKLKKYMTLFQWAECLAIIVFTIYFALTNTTDTWWYILIDSLLIYTLFSPLARLQGFILARTQQHWWLFCHPSACA